jgi:hypothetical protein
MNYLSNANLRAVLTILVARAGGEVHITNDEIYEAMMPSSGLIEHLVVESLAGGIHVSVRDSYSAEPDGRPDRGEAVG